MRWLLPTLVLVALGCGRPAAPALRSDDVVRPEIAVAPAAPWKAGDVIAVGFLARIDRPDGTTFYLKDEDVPLDRATMTARVVFLDGDRPATEPHEVPFVHDC
jgi:hypothetical protein